jgi:DNA helicase-2/ATP-dependent DNA helicase PcrA
MELVGPWFKGKTTLPLALTGTAARTASNGPRIDVGARMRGMWR